MSRSPGQVSNPRGYTPTKRTIDVVVCLVALPVLLPLGLLCALLIRIESPGPILFAQQRTGQHGVRFPMWKFRTMVQNAEELKASLQHLNILPAPDFKIPNDPRITRVGRILRKTSLDELPQVIDEQLRCYRLQPFEQRVGGRAGRFREQHVDAAIVDPRPVDEP